MQGGEYEKVDVGSIKEMYEEQERRLSNEEQKQAILRHSARPPASR